MLYSILSENGITIEQNTPDNLYEFLLQYFEEYGFYSEQESDMREMEETIRDKSFFDESTKKLQLLKQELNAAINDEQLSRNHLFENYNGSSPDTEVPVVLKQIDIETKSLNAQIVKEKELLDQMEEDISCSVPVDDKSKDLSAQRLIIEKELLGQYKKSRISEYICTLLDEAVSKREQHLFKALSVKTVELLHRLTSNQYITQINEDTVYGFITGRPTISFNTQISHMMTLCAKIALSDFLTLEDIPLPLFIDAPSTYMDSQRIKILIEIAAEYSRKRQIVILTHDRNLCIGAGVVVEL